MRALALIPLALLAACYVPDREDRKESDTQDITKMMVSNSVVTCADGNQVRTMIYTLAGQSAAFSSWTILNSDGTPKRCESGDSSL